MNNGFTLIIVDTIEESEHIVPLDNEYSEILAKKILEYIGGNDK